MGGALPVTTGRVFCPAAREAGLFRHVLGARSSVLPSRRDAAFAPGEAMVLTDLSASAGPGDDAISGTSEADLITGGAGNDTLQGRGGDNTLIGGAGDDLLDGGAGADRMSGGMGNDLYYWRDAEDVILEETGGGTDTVLVWDTARLGAHLENLVLKGTAAAALSGNELANRLVGNMAGNLLRGEAGDDTLVGQGGDDTLIGGDGLDVLSGGDGSDLYYLIGPHPRWQDAIVLESAGHSGIDHVITNVSVSLGDTHVENVSIIGAGRSVVVQANSLANTLRGSRGDDGLFGYGGNDRIEGREGHDRLDGGAGDDTLLGGAGQDTLSGGPGADHLSGGAGDDDYYIDDVGDRIVETAGGGRDSVHSAIDMTLAPALEDLTLQGGARVGNGNDGANHISPYYFNNRTALLLQGNGGDDTIYGGTADDTLRGGTGNDLLHSNNGNDLLDGGTGADTLRGGPGNDTYILDDAGDVIEGEDRRFGQSDTVITSVSVAFDAAQDIENIRLTGTGAIDAVRYDGGLHEGELRGNSGDNLLDGARGARDTMLGGRGNDIYVVEHRSDRVIEGADAGTDMVRSAVSYSLTAHVEDLLLTAAHINGFGNGLDNVIAGSDGDNRLAGRGGNDTLTGNGGADSFVFNLVPGDGTLDHITDFISGTDRIALHARAFAGLEVGPLAAGALQFGTVAQGAEDRLIYDRASGSLYFDADGTGSADAVLFAMLDSRPLITAADVEIV